MAPDALRGSILWSGAVLILIVWTGLLGFLSEGWTEDNSLALPPAWDHALYLHASLRFHRSYENGGIPALIHELRSRPSAVGPLLPLSSAPFYRAFGESRDTAQLTLLPWTFLLLLATLLLSLKARCGPLHAALSVFLLSTFAGVVNFSREYMMDLPGAAMAAFGLFWLWRSDGLRRGADSLLAGIGLGLTLLTKVLAGIFFAGPVLYSLTRKGRPRLSGIGLFAVGLLAFAGPWFVAHGDEVLHYVLYYGFGDGSLPFRTGGIAYYGVSLVREGMGPPPSMFLVLALAAVLFQHRVARRPLWQPESFLLVWLASGALLLTLMPNKGGERYVLGLLPPLAVLAASATASLDRPALRRGAAALAVILGTAHYAALTWPGPLRHGTHHHFQTFPHGTALSPVEARSVWPVEPVLEALIAIRPRIVVEPSPEEMQSFLVEARKLDDDRFLQEGYRRILKREPDPPGRDAYRRALHGGTSDRAHVMMSIAASRELRSRPLRVLVIPDHRVFNASTLRYLAELHRKPIELRHLSSSGEGDFLWEYDAALVKVGGDQGPRHETRSSSELERRIRALWGSAPAASLACPDGSRIEILLSRRERAAAP